MNEDRENSNPYDSPSVVRPRTFARSKPPMWAVIAVATPTFIVLFCATNLLAISISSLLFQADGTDITGAALFFGLAASVVVAGFGGIMVTKLFTRRKFGYSLSGASDEERTNKLRLQETLDQFHAEESSEP